MKIRYWVASLLLLQAASGVASAGEGFQVTPHIGSTTLEIHPATLVSNRYETVDTLETGAQLSYVTPIGFMVEGGIATQSNFGWFGAVNKYRLNEYTLAIGYQFETANGFRIIPKAGRSRWHLNSSDNLLVNANTQRPNTIRDLDYFWELGLQKKISDSVALGVSYKDNPYKFGNVQSIAFTASFGL